MAKAAKKKAKSKPYEIPPKADLAALLNGIGQIKHEAKELTGDIGPMTEKFAKRYGQNTKAITELQKIHAMSENKRADYLRTLIPGILLMEEDWGAGTGDLFDEVPSLSASIGGGGTSGGDDSDLSDEDFADPKATRSADDVVSRIRELADKPKPGRQEPRPH